MYYSEAMMKNNDRVRRKRPIKCSAVGNLLEHTYFFKCDFILRISNLNYIQQNNDLTFFIFTLYYSRDNLQSIQVYLNIQVYNNQ